MDVNISWEGHLSGFITGFLFALFFKRNIPKPKKYVWEEDHFNAENDPFLKQFDEHGNFIENLNPEEEENQTNINYTFKRNKE